MVDSGDAALVGAVGGAAVAYHFSDGDTKVALLGAGAGLVVAGEGADQIIGKRGG